MYLLVGTYSILTRLGPTYLALGVLLSEPFQNCKKINNVGLDKTVVLLPKLASLFTVCIFVLLLLLVMSINNFLTVQ